MNNFPAFPIFKKLELDDQNIIKNFANKFSPYSDYNFTSLWTYNTKEILEFSFLHQNLIIKFQDYLTGKPFYSFLGEEKADETITELLELSSKEKVARELKLIPEISIKNFKNSSRFLIEEDVDNFDYVLSVDDLVELKGNKYRGKRNFVNRFVQRYGEVPVEILNLNDPRVQNEILELFLLWKQAKSQTDEETEIELTAIKRLLKDNSYFNLIPIGIYIDGKLKAFSIDEIVQNDYAMIHFEKADTNYIGIFQYLKRATARHVKELGCTKINYEQDLGIEGLRKAKQSWMPTIYLKKYKVKFKS